MGYLRNLCSKDMNKRETKWENKTALFKQIANLLKNTHHTEPQKT